MTEPKFAPGFRLSGLDVLILVAGGAGAVAYAFVDRWMGMAVGFVVAHFFLFCNILRITRRAELIWAATFVLFAAAAMGEVLLSWPLAFALSAGVTLIAALVELRRPSYHGVGWRTLNSKLPEWWRAQTGGGSGGPR
jgi:hypothetical protein